MNRRRWLVIVWTAPTLVLLAIASWIYGTYRIEVPAPLDANTRAAVLAPLRAALEQTPAPATEPGSRKLANRGPLVASIWHDGKLIARVDAYADTLSAATVEAVRLMGLHPALNTLDADARRLARLKVDLVVARGPLPRRVPVLQTIGLNPGLEGLGVRVSAEHEHLLLPDELVIMGLLSRARPMSMVPEVSLGLDFERADMIMAQRARMPAGGYGSAERSYFRFRTDSFLEEPLATRTGAGLPLYRGLTPGPALSKATLREAGLSGARYLIAHLSPSGRYIYQTNLSSGLGTNPDVPGPYSIPRHAGTTYFLAEAYRITGEAFLLEPTERAFAHLEQLLAQGGCKGTTPSGAAYACVTDRGETTAALGSTALTVVALAEYERATGSQRYRELAVRLSEWLLLMHRPDGSFAHLFDVAKQRPDPTTQLFYFTGEAALALARMHLVTGDVRYRDAAKTAIDWLVDWYDFFVGGFFYGEEHWTCIAAEALYPAVNEPRYAAFCEGYAAFLRDQQPDVGEHPDEDDFAGSYGVTPFIPPQNTPAGSRTEAMISTYLLGRHLGQPSAATRAQIMKAAAYTLRQQIRLDNDFNVAAAAKGVGAIPGSPTDRNVRIDFVQHVCSALIRASELLE